MLTTVTLTSGRSFRSSDSSSILDSGIPSRVILPHSCKTGRCGTCKCKVITGETKALVAELGLTDSEKSEGWILSCARAATTDLVLEVEDLGRGTIPPTRIQACRISRLKRLATDAIEVVLRLPPEVALAYIPGQYIDVIGPGGVRRSYSLANAPRADNQLELHIRAVHGGVMSEYWFQRAKVNDLLRFNGPLGTFFLRSVDQIHLVFLATGTGIAPIKAMLESLTHIPPENAPISVTLFWGGRTAEDLYLDPQAIPAGHRFIPVLSRAPAGWVGISGYVQNALLATKPDLARTAVYACGSNTMIRNAKASLLAAGLPDNCFFADAFVPSAPR
jgi:CDP-4-dehydro-6-deoxyglucose reductase